MPDGFFGSTTFPTPVQLSKQQTTSYSIGRHIDFPEDCERIRQVCLGWLRREITLSEAQELWEVVSEEYCASWLVLPESNTELAEMITDIIGGGEETNASQGE